MSDQAPAEVRRKRVSPFRFMQEVREEGRKVTWPTMREVVNSSVVVIVSVLFLMAFLAGADIVLARIAGVIFGG